MESKKQIDPSPYIGWVLLAILIYLSLRSCNISTTCEKQSSKFITTQRS